MTSELPSDPEKQAEYVEGLLSELGWEQEADHSQESAEEALQRLFERYDVSSYEELKTKWAALLKREHEKTRDLIVQLIERDFPWVDVEAIRDEIDAEARSGRGALYERLKRQHDSRS